MNQSSNNAKSLFLARKSRLRRASSSSTSMKTATAAATASAHQKDDDDEYVVDSRSGMNGNVMKSPLVKRTISGSQYQQVLPQHNAIQLPSNNNQQRYQNQTPGRKKLITGGDSTGLTSTTGSTPSSSTILGSIGGGQQQPRQYLQLSSIGNFILRKVNTFAFVGVVLFFLFCTLLGTFYSLSVLSEQLKDEEGAFLKGTGLIRINFDKSRVLRPSFTFRKMSKLESKSFTNPFHNISSNAQQNPGRISNESISRQPLRVVRQLQLIQSNGKVQDRFKNVTLIDMRVLNQELKFDNPDGGVWKQGYNVAPRFVAESEPLNIWVVPHSHCDPGWIKTFDQYFKQQTSQIVSTVIDSLKKDVRRKFIWAEISYFSWWYENQTAETKQHVKILLANRQLEFVTGGWVQPDEANSELYAMEIQLQEGHDWINQTFGAKYIPKYGWSIDPFGYSSTAAYLWKRYNFKAMLIQRVHYAVKKHLALNQHLEFYWRQTWDRSGEYDIYTHLMPFFSYDIPHTCGPDPSVCCQFDFKRRVCPWHKSPIPITHDNVRERSMLLLDQYLKKAELYRRHNAVLIPLGDDFRWQTLKEAEDQYNSYQTMFDYINQNVPGVNIQFGTLSDYFDYVLDDQSIQEKARPNEAVPILMGSFFTYSDVNEDYWSGYFTSRVFDKALDRKLERVLFAAESIGSYTRQQLQVPRRELSLFQHHDGITGTAKDHVVEDYARRLHSAIAQTHEWIIEQFRGSSIYRSDPGILLLDNANSIQPCIVSEASRSGFASNHCGANAEVIAYNPLPFDQQCNDVKVAGYGFKRVQLPCERPGIIKNATKTGNFLIEFDRVTGMMIKPIREEWKIWNVFKGGAYLFFPGDLVDYLSEENPSRDDNDIVIENDGYVVRTKYWTRTVIQKEIPQIYQSSTEQQVVFDFIYETNLTIDNQEWITRFVSNSIKNDGIFHTDLNGFNFDTHKYRKDMPIQSQVYPMPTLASIQDKDTRLTVISEHAQGTASLEEGTIDVWLDRRLKQDDDRGVFQGVQDNRPTQTRLRVLLETTGVDVSFNVTSEFDVTALTQHMWDALQHPLEFYGKHVVTTNSNGTSLL